MGIVPSFRDTETGSLVDRVEDTTRFGVDTEFRSVTQGSSFLATLGFVTESLWDS
jgi:hypothetical protein